MKDLLLKAKQEEGGFDFAKFKKLYISKYVNGEQKRHGSPKNKENARVTTKSLTLEADPFRSSIDSALKVEPTKPLKALGFSQTPAPLKG